MGVIINRKLPELASLLEALADWRKHPIYTVRELAMCVIFIFFFKRGSRNNADNTARKGNFSKNISKVFGCRIPDTDTSDLLMRYLPIDILEKIKQSVVQKLLRDKTFSGWRTQRNRYCIAVDATSIHTFKTEPYPNCCYKDSKQGHSNLFKFSNGSKIIVSQWFQHFNYDRMDHKRSR